MNNLNSKSESVAFTPWAEQFIVNIVNDFKRTLEMASKAGVHD